MTAKQLEYDASRETLERRPLRFYNVRVSAKEAWLGAAFAASFNLLGMLLEMAIVARIPGIAKRPALVSAGLAVLMLLFLFIRRKTPTYAWAGVIYSLVTASVVAALLSTNVQFAVADRNWQSFQAAKLGCLVAAIVAPGFWIGLLSIFAYALSALVQFEFFFPPEIKAGMDAAEPWPIVVFALAGGFALVYRFRRIQLEQEVARLQAHNFAIKRLANAFLDIRDLMNTPLQVIELSVDLLRRSKEPPKPLLDRIDRSVQNLIEINSVLVRHEKEIEMESKE